MSHEPSDGVPLGGERMDGWPVPVEGVVETIVATEGPNGVWNQAALGVHPAGDRPARIDAGSTDPATARSFGRTRTRRNLEVGRGAFVQFTRDPVDFVDAALSVFETSEPIIGSADAWTRVSAEPVDRTNERGTEIVEWSLRPVESGVRERVVPTTTRGRAAVIEATVPASRLDVEGYDDRELLDRLSWLADVVKTAGDPRTRAAFERIDEHVGWRDRVE